MKTANHPDFRTKISEHVYGPVNSRRHGMSLGVNLGGNEKICSWSCLYCQYGFGRFVREGEAQAFVPASQIFQEIVDSLSAERKIRSVTIAGNSEPGLYPELPRLIELLKRYQVSSRARWKITILSNGSEIHDDAVLKACNLADETWLKLDCGREDTFHRLNRPMHSRHGLGAHLTRLQRIQHLYVQTLLWGCTTEADLGNGKPEDLDSLLDCYRLLQPKKVHLYTLERAPAFSSLSRVPAATLEAFASKIREINIDCEVFP